MAAITQIPAQTEGSSWPRRQKATFPTEAARYMPSLDRVEALSSK